MRRDADLNFLLAAFSTTDKQANFRPRPDHLQARNRSRQTLLPTLCAI
jgi:hypothetical protein